MNRPETADHDGEVGSVSDLHRPFTQSSSHEMLSLDQSPTKQSEKLHVKESNRDPYCVTGSEVQVVLVSNWGDPSYIGLTGISVLLTDSQAPLTPKPDQIEVVFPPSLGCEAHLNHQVSDISALVDEDDLTTDAAHMWVCPVPASGESLDSTSPTIIIKLDEPKLLRGLRVWNYNASLEDSYKGVSNLIVVVVVVVVVLLLLLLLECRNFLCFVDEIIVENMFLQHYDLNHIISIVFHTSIKINAYILIDWREL